MKIKTPSCKARSFFVGYGRDARCGVNVRRGGLVADDEGFGWRESCNSAEFFIKIQSEFLGKRGNLTHLAGTQCQQADAPIDQNIFDENAKGFPLFSAKQQQPD